MSSFPNFLTDSVAMDYSEFAPRLYNLCKQFGLRCEHMRLASAFCSDEEQGCPRLILTKHFGMFPVDIGTASGGINYPEISEEHATDLVIVQASHMGCIPASKGHEDHQESERMKRKESCVCHYQYETLRWYQKEYQFAQKGISINKEDGRYLLIIDNQLLNDGGREGLWLNMDKLVQRDASSNYVEVRQYSTAKAFETSEDFVERITETHFKKDEVKPIGQHLDSDLFYFKRNTTGIPGEECYRLHELNALMPEIITSPWPALALARASIQVEFDHTFRTLVKDKKYHDKNLVYITGVHQNVMQTAKRAFIPTLFVPWAAYIQQRNGIHIVLEQPELVKHLSRCPSDNTEKINLDIALREMERRGHLRVIDSGMPDH